MSLVNLDDCYYFYTGSGCAKGPGCPFRHEPAALNQETVCTYWLKGNCSRPNCYYRHAKNPKKRGQISCYWETQPSGCQKPHCPFLHEVPKGPIQQQQQQLPQPLLDPYKPSQKTIIVNKNKINELSHLISGSGVAALPSSEEPSADSGRSVYVPSTAPVVLAAGGGIKARLGGHGEDLRSRLRKPGGGGVKARLGGLRTADEEFEDYEEEETIELYECCSLDGSDEDGAAAAAPNSEEEALRRSAIQTLDLRKRLRTAAPSSQRSRTRSRSPLSVRGSDQNAEGSDGAVVPNEDSEDEEYESKKVKSVVKKVKKDKKERKERKKRKKEKREKKKKFRLKRKAEEEEDESVQSAEEQDQEHMRVVKRIVLSDQDAESPRSRSRSSSEKEEMSLADRIASKREREGPGSLSRDRCSTSATRSPRKSRKRTHNHPTHEEPTDKKQEPASSPQTPEDSEPQAPVSPSPSPPPSRKGEDDEENREAGKATEVGDSPDAKKKRTSDRSEQRSPKKKRKKEEEDALVTKYHSVVGNRKLRIKGGSADGGVTTKEEVDEMERFLKEHPEVLSKQNESVDVMKELDELLQED